MSDIFEGISECLDCCPLEGDLMDAFAEDSEEFATTCCCLPFVNEDNDDDIMKAVAISKGIAAYADRYKIYIPDNNDEGPDNIDMPMWFDSLVIYFPAIAPFFPLACLTTEGVTTRLF